MMATSALRSDTRRQASLWGPIRLGAALAAIAQVMLLVGVLAALFHIRPAGGAWPPRNVHLDNFRGTTLVLTVFLASATAQWAARAARMNDQRNTVVGLGMSMGLSLASADLAWYTLSKAGFAAGSSLYATLFYGLLAIFIGMAIIAALALLSVGIRAIGGQFSAAHHDPVAAVTLQVHATTLGWVLIYLAVWVRK